MIEKWAMIENERRKFLHNKFEALGISYGEAVVLLVIANNPSVSQDNISMLTGLGKASIAKILSALEDKQLIAREVNDHNKREKLTHLLPTGQAMIAELSDCIKTWNKVCFLGLSENEMNMLNEILDKIVYNLKNEVEVR